MKSNLVSVIIPVYNQQQTRLERCLDSVQRQSYKNYEVIIVDDGSCEQFKSCIKQVCAPYDNISCIHKQNGGSGAARNCGVANAKGDYIMFLDSDDMLSEFALEDAMRCILDTGSDMVVGQVHKEKESEWNGGLISREESRPIIIDSEDGFNEYINHILGYLSERFIRNDRYFCDGPIAKVFKKELFIKAQFDTQKFWGEDTIWNLAFTKQCKKISISSNVWYYAFANSDSQTHIFRPNCPYEFKYRIQEESDLIRRLWPECLEGLYNQVWVSTYYLMNCNILHKDNSSSLFRKYSVFVDCINHQVYKVMLKNIRFGDEKNTYKRVVKKTICFFSLHGPKIVAYLGWLLTLGVKRGER